MIDKAVTICCPLCTVMDSKLKSGNLHFIRIIRLLITVIRGFGIAYPEGIFSGQIDINIRIYRSLGSFIIIPKIDIPI